MLSFFKTRINMICDILIRYGNYEPINRIFKSTSELKITLLQLVKVIYFRLGIDFKHTDELKDKLQGFRVQGYSVFNYYYFVYHSIALQFNPEKLKGYNFSKMC